VLADGTTFTQTATVSQSGRWPLNVPLYNGQGLLLSWINFASTPSEDLHGELNWIKLALPAAAYYPGGFALTTTVTGSRYRVPPTGTRVLNFSAGQVALNLDGGVLSIVNSITLTANNHVTNLSSNKLTLTINLSTGVFTGTVVNPATAASIPFTGVVLQKPNAGYGYFRSAGQSGQVSFGP
jgi:hypothetical protein